MAGKSGELASAVVLADSAFEMIIDAADVLKDVGDLTGHAELYALAGQLSKTTEKIRARKAEIDASEPANENDPTDG